MQNSFSRKSVAAVTCVSFGVLGFAAPASADTDTTMFYEERVSSATLSPMYGTTNTVPYYSDFEFEVDLNGDIFNVGVSSNDGDEDGLSEFFTSTTTLADLKVRVNGLDKDDYAFYSEDFEGSQGVGNDLSWNDYDNQEDYSDIAWSLENESDIATLDYLVVEANPAVTIDGATLEFTFWRDTDDDYEIDGSEWKSATSKITWLADDKITHTPTLDLEYGDDWWDVSVTANYNAAMYNAHGFLDTYAVLLRNGDPTDAESLSYNAEDGYYVNANNNNDDLAAEDEWYEEDFDAASYTVQTYVDTDDEEDYDGAYAGAGGDDQLLGSASLRLRTPRVDYIQNFAAVGSANVGSEDTAIDGFIGDEPEYDDFDVYVRKGTTSATLEGYAYDAEDSAVGGVTLHVGLNAFYIEEDTTVTINGKAITGKALNEDGLDEFPVTTDSKGRFSFTFSTSNTAAYTDEEYFDFYVYEPYSDAADYDYAYLYWETASYSAYDLLTSEQSEAGEDYDGTSPTRSIEIGKTLEVTFAVVDQWGVGAPDGRSLKATRSPLAGNERTTTGTQAVWNANAEDEDTIFMTTKDGKITLKVTDNGKGEGTDIVTVTGVSESISLTDDQVFEVDYLEDTKVAKMVVRTDNDGVTDYNPGTDGWSEDSEDWGTADAPIELQSITLVNWDERLNPGTEPLYAFDGAFDEDGTSDSVTSSVTVTDANGAPIKGIAVTWTGAGFAFEADGSVETFSVGSITMITDEDGEASVDVFGSRSGAQTLTITSGTQTATQTFTFEQKAAKDFTLTAPASSGPGKAVDVVVKMTDADGTTVS
ncbi:MAG: hypothetical protein RL718_508, partial [Actinomycetota bacterium]